MDSNLPNFPSPSFSDGFTLAEILIVVSVFGFITGIAGTAGKTQIDKAFDAKRKSDVSKIAKSLEEFYNDHGCYPENTQWESVSCGDENSILSPYLRSSIPCDPYSKEKYSYEATNIDGTRCDDSCGECFGYRVLAHLSNKNDPAISYAGCDPTGCGIDLNDRPNPNWGLAMGHDVPVPGFYPGKGEDVGHQTQDHDCRHTKDPGCDISVTPTTTTSPTPSIAPTPTPPVITCTSNTIKNASFEIDADNDSQPDDWLLAGYLWMNEDEGVVCTDASSGNCSLYGYDDEGKHWIGASQLLPLSGTKGTMLKFSIDAKSPKPRYNGFASGFATLDLRLNFKNDTNTASFHKTAEMLFPHWSRTSIMHEAPFDFENVYVSVDLKGGLYHDFPLFVDNACLEEVNHVAPSEPEASSCPGQLISNGSFEHMSNTLDPQMPDNWYIERAGGALPFEGEFYNCERASNGNCSLLFYSDLEPDPNNDSVSYRGFYIRSDNVVDIKKGETYELSADVHVTDPYNTQAGPAPYLSVEFFKTPTHVGASDQFASLGFSTYQKDQWIHKSTTFTADDNYVTAEAHIGYSFDRGVETRYDNICLQKISP